MNPSTPDRRQRRFRSSEPSIVAFAMANDRKENGGTIDC
jgi:hypothetical protein